MKYLCRECAYDSELPDDQIEIISEEECMYHDKTLCAECGEEVERQNAEDLCNNCRRKAGFERLLE